MLQSLTLSLFIIMLLDDSLSLSFLPTACCLSILQIVLFQQTVFSNRHTEKHREEETVITMRRPVDTERQTNRCICQFWRPDYRILQLEWPKKYNSHQTTQIDFLVYFPIFPSTAAFYNNPYLMDILPEKVRVGWLVDWLTGWSEEGKLQ